MGIKQHFVGLQQIGADHKSAAVRQLDMGDLQLGALTGQNRKILTPVELDRFAKVKSQRNKGATPRRLAFSLPIKSPVTGKRRNPVVGARKPKHHQIGMQLL